MAERQRLSWHERRAAPCAQVPLPQNRSYRVRKSLAPRYVIQATAAMARLVPSAGFSPNSLAWPSNSETRQSKNARNRTECGRTN